VDLEDLVARLSREPSVDGVVLVGSTETGQLRPVSDYDILIILEEPSPALLVGLTTIGGRLTDLLFGTVAEVDHLLSAAPAASIEAWPARIMRWVGEGRIAFDRSGRLARLRTLAAERRLAAYDTGPYETWFSLNYDLAQNRRLSASDDSTDRTALQLRLLHGVFELVKGYLRSRDLEWSGEKAAVRYLADHDPDYFAAVNAFLGEADPQRRIAAYEALAVRTLEPFGGVWKPGETAFQFRPGTDVSPELVSEAARFWESLVSA
jgi:predicted nucleotidyltransferase